MDNIRFVLIVAFGVLVFMLQQAWEADYGPKPPLNQTINAIEKVKDDVPNTNLSLNTPNQTITLPQTTESITKVISVNTDVLHVEISTDGATIQKLELLNYPIEQENTAVNFIKNLIGISIESKNTAPIRLFNNNPEHLFLAQNGLIADSGSASIADHHSVFNATQETYTLSSNQEVLSVPLIWTSENGMIVTKTFSFKRGSYTINLDQEIENNSHIVWSGRQYNQLLRVPEVNNTGGLLTSGMRAYDGGVIYTEKEKYQKVDFDDMHDENLNVSTQGGWTAMIQHYFASAWIPNSNQENHFYTKELKNNQYVIGTYTPTITVEPQNKVKVNSQLFAGPKIQSMMENVSPGLELTVDYGVLTFIGKPIYALLNSIHSLVGNWGVAIMGVTLVIKLFLFPLSQSSFKSMAKMRKVQPRLKELQERFADDRPRFNQEMMELYKKEKVNPLGGCLPIFIQIPVFMSLYWVLSETVEFRQAPFVLWIQDLSVQDPFFVLPILYGITMKIQQSLNPPPIDPIQAKVMKMFPIVFTVFFLFFPAGLVWYWVVNNTLSVIQQAYITKKIENAS